jgi:hypothetical protein
MRLEPGRICTLMMSDSVNTTNPTTNPVPRFDTPSWGLIASSPWTWMVLACMLLGASGGVRAWQDHRFATVLNRVESAPFPLKNIPRALGDWRVQDGSEKRLDPEVAQVAGCSDSVIRTYHNSTTGVSVTVLILFGPAQAVFGHRPEVCYPSAGYRIVGEPLLREIANDPGRAAMFRSEVFAREREKRRGREEVYYSFRHGNLWSPDVERFWKDFRHHPSMFKIQVQRPVSEVELRDVGNPTETLLALLVPEIERLIAAQSQDQHEE